MWNTFFYRALAAVVCLLPVSLRVKLWKHALRPGRRRWELESAAQRIPGGMYIKMSTYRIRPTEALVLRYVYKHTSIPVPIVIDNFTHDGMTYLVMSRLPGYNLGCLYQQITPDVERLLSTQLSRILAPLRALIPPSGAICAFDGGPVYCGRIRLHVEPAGPWKSVTEFHENLLLRTGGLEFPEHIDAAEANGVIRRAHARKHRICLTHNDLGPHNILVDENWTITGIIDWEAAAWMPEY